MTVERVAVVGLGLVGGSLARALTSRGTSLRGWDADPLQCALARAAGIDVEPLGMSAVEGVVRDAAIVVLAVPLASIAAAAATVVESAPAEASLFHVAGLQRPGALRVTDDVHRRLLGTHPLAGSERAGFAASRADLFEGATVSVEERANAAQRAAAERLWHAAGASRLVYRDASEHDALMARISHLPQLASTALAASLARAGVPYAETGPAARDLTRLAGSSLGVWEGVLAAGAPDAVAALDAFRATLDELRTALARGDRDTLGQVWNRAGAWRAAEMPT